MGDIIAKRGAPPSLETAPNTAPTFSRETLGRIGVRYWSSLAIVVVLVLIAGFGVVGGLIVLVALPLLQLVVSAAWAVRILGTPDEERRERWRHWGWVTGGSFVGALLGAGVMWLLL